MCGDNNEGLALLDFFEKNGGTLVWRKYQQRYPKIWDGHQFIVNKTSTYPPFLAFRFESENVEFLRQTQSIVNSFQGNVEWVMYSHKRKKFLDYNWVILPKISRNIELSLGYNGSELGNYMESQHPGIIELSFDDLPQLLVSINP